MRGVFGQFFVLRTTIDIAGSIARSPEPRHRRASRDASDRADGVADRDSRGLDQSEQARVVDAARAVLDLAEGKLRNA